MDRGRVSKRHGCAMKGSESKVFPLINLESKVVDFLWK